MMAPDDGLGSGTFSRPSKGPESGTLFSPARRADHQLKQAGDTRFEPGSLLHVTLQRRLGLTLKILIGLGENSGGRLIGVRRPKGMQFQSNGVMKVANFARVASADVPGGRDRLVQPARGDVAAVEHPGWLVAAWTCSRRPGGGRPRGLQHRPGSAVHGGGVHGLAGDGAAVSMDGRGRALDNVFVERLWRTVKYEISPFEAKGGAGAAPGLGPVLRLPQ